MWWCLWLLISIYIVCVIYIISFLLYCDSEELLSSDTWYTECTVSQITTGNVLKQYIQYTAMMTWAVILQMITPFAKRDTAISYLCTGCNGHYRLQYKIPIQKGSGRIYSAYLYWGQQILFEHWLIASDTKCLYFGMHVVSLMASKCGLCAILTEVSGSGNVLIDSVYTCSLSIYCVDETDENCFYGPSTPICLYFNRCKLNASKLATSSNSISSLNIKNHLLRACGHKLSWVINTFISVKTK